MNDPADPWEVITDAHPCRGLEDELRKEVGPRHELWNRAAKPIARRVDDVAFLLEDGRIAEVHLTWKGMTEADPRWPATRFFLNVEDWHKAIAGDGRVEAFLGVIARLNRAT